MDASDIHYNAKEIAARLHREMKAKRITRVDIDTIRAACAGYLCAGLDHANGQQLEDFENATLRKFVEACA